MSDVGRAVRARRDPRFVRHAYECFLGGESPPGLDPVVLASWQRSLRTGVNPDRLDVLVEGSDDDFRARREQHRLAAVMPLIRRLLVDPAIDDDLVIAVTDDDGRLLWIEGSPRTRSLVDPIGFVEGAVWDERAVGTNAPGTALATSSAVQVLGAEHFVRPVQTLNCAAAPIRDPHSGKTLGVLDITGGGPAASMMALSLVRTTALMLERELSVSSGPGEIELFLGSRPRLVTADGSVPLSLRHAEILALLNSRPDGLTAGELAVQLHAGELSEVAVRAEVSRLRRVAGHLLADTRPYRLVRPLVSAPEAVRDLLAGGEVARAVAASDGPLLPRSVAPGIEELRDEYRTELRTAVLASRDLAVVERWTRTAEGEGDYQAWQVLAELARPTSPAWVRAQAQLEHLDRFLA